MRLISIAALAALVVFGGCNSRDSQSVTAPPPTQVKPPPDTPPPRLLLFASEATRAPVETALRAPAVQSAVSAATGFVPDEQRAFAIAGSERGRDVQVTFLPLVSESDPEVVRFVVHARSGDTEAVHSALIRRAPPEVPGRFRQYGHLWVALDGDGAVPDAARWSDDQKSDFWTCVIDRTTTTVVSCAIGCVFTVGGWVPCVAYCTTAGELAVVAGCAARVLVNTWRGRYNPENSNR